LNAQRKSKLHLVVVLLVCLARPLPAADGVPPGLQANLILKVAPFDTSLASLQQIQLLVVARRDDAASQHLADEVSAALKQQPQIAGLPLHVAQIEAGGVPQLLQEIRARKPAIVYLSTSFSRDAAAIAAGLGGEHVLTIAAESAAVQGGICVGFDLIAGRPLLLVHLGQSQKQHVQFQPGFLHLAKVVDS